MRTLRQNQSSLTQLIPDSIKRVILHRMKNKGLAGAVDSALRAWDLVRHRAGGDLRLFCKYRGDNEIASITRLIGLDLIRNRVLDYKVF
jgi:hypothetical protein